MSHSHQDTGINMLHGRGLIGKRMTCDAQITELFCSHTEVSSSRQELLFSSIEPTLYSPKTQLSITL